MTDFLDLHARLDAHLAAMTAPTVEGIFYGNVEDSRMSADKIYLRPTFLPGISVDLGQADTSAMRRDGIYQIDVFIPKGEGEKRAYDLANAIEQHFPKGQTLQDVRIKRVDVDSGAPSGSHYQLPVLVYFVTITR